MKNITLFLVVGEMGAGKTLTQTQLGFKNWWSRKMKLYSNYHLYKLPYYYLETIKQIDFCRDGVVLLDEFWKICDARLSRKASNRVVADILARSRKRQLIYIFTAQVLDSVDKRIKKVTDFSSYPLEIGQFGNTTKVLIFRTAVFKNSNFMKQFYFDRWIPQSCYNSILPDQNVFFFNDDNLHIEPVENIKKNADNFCPYDHMKIPTFDKKIGMTNKLASAFIGHQVKKDCYEIETQYGRKIKTTGDHSLISLYRGRVFHKPVRKMKIGDYLLIPKRFTPIEKDIDYIHITDWVNDAKYNGKYKFELLVPTQKELIEENKDRIRNELKDGSKRAYKMLHLYKKKGYLPYSTYKKIFPKRKQEIRLTSRYLDKTLKNKIKINNDFLWLLGFYMAEGCSGGMNGAKNSIAFCSEERLLDKTERIIKKFGVHYTRIRASEKKNTHAPIISISNRLLSILFHSLTHKKEWMLQLPLSKLKWILYGLWEGDGYHNGKFGNRFTLVANDESILNFTMYALSRFGIVAGKKKYSYLAKIHRRFGKEYKNKIVNQGRIYASVKDMNILNWDKIEDNQKMIDVKRIKDLIAVKIRNIKKFDYEGYAYDFSVPDTHNFLAGDMILAHNSYEEIDTIDDTSDENPAQPPKLMWQEGTSRCNKCKFVMTQTDRECPQCQGTEFTPIEPMFFNDWDTADAFATTYWEKLLSKEGITDTEDGVI
jgi:intein/homing endonuclease